MVAPKSWVQIRGEAENFYKFFKLKTVIVGYPAYSVIFLMPHQERYNDVLL